MKKPPIYFAPLLALMIVLSIVNALFAVANFNNGNYAVAFINALGAATATFVAYLHASLLVAAFRNARATKNSDLV